MEQNNNSSNNTILIVIILVIIVAALVWFFAQGAAPAPTDQSDNETGATIEVNLPGGSVGGDNGNGEE